MKLINKIILHFEKAYFDSWKKRNAKKKFESAEYYNFDQKVMNALCESKKMTPDEEV